MKLTLFVISTSLVISVSTAQNKLLTIQEAVLKGRTTLAPKRLQALGFISGTDKFTYVDNHQIKIGNGADGKVTDALSLSDLNALLKSQNKDTLANFNAITW